MDKQEEFIKTIRATFKVQATEGIDNITRHLIELEKDPQSERAIEFVEVIYRDAHSLKGAARAVNISAIESICQALESVFSKIKNKKIELNPKLFDLFHQTTNTLGKVLKSPEDQMSKTLRDEISDLISNLTLVEEGELQQIEAPLKPQKPQDSSQAASSATSIKTDTSRVNDSLEEEDQTQKEEPLITENVTPAIEPEPLMSRSTDRVKKEEVDVQEDQTIRISVEKLDNILFKGEEILTLNQSFMHLSEGINQTVKKLNNWTVEAKEIKNLLDRSKKLSQEVDTDIETIQSNTYQNKVWDFIDWTLSFINSLNTDLGKLKKYGVNETFESGVRIDSLLTEVKKMISVPFSSLIDSFPKMARDLSRENGKDVVMIVKGSELEIDRRILEEIKNPLIHLLRNSIDHGIEKPSVRKMQNKPEKGTIRLNIDRLENNKVEIIISDDGAGIDFEKAKKKYIKQENIPPDEISQITNQTLINFLFRSGISTSDMITDLSGRGLGLAIVQEKIDHLGGSVQVSSIPGQETTFRIELPLSLVTFRGVRILVNQNEFVIPTAKIERVLRLPKSAIKTVKNKATVPYLDDFIPLVRLSDILEYQTDSEDHDNLIIIIITSGETRIGYVVEEILNEEIILVKNFNPQLKRIRNISGATVLGSGKVIPILNISDLIKSAQSKETTFHEKTGTIKKEEKKSILVVEDSITSRMLLKNILESAGYVVFTAIDGIDGYTKLKEGKFDLVVSDVDMPRLSGLDLTAKIRADKAVSEIPIVLVTSLSKREDKERGMEVGANAYIIKSSFDQSNLLDVIYRLLEQ